MSQQIGGTTNIYTGFMTTKLEALASGFDFSILTPLEDIYSFLANLERGEVHEVSAEDLNEVSPRLVFTAIAFGLPVKTRGEFFIDVICPTDDGRVVQTYLTLEDVAKQIYRYSQTENLSFEMVGNRLFHYGSVGLQSCYNEPKVQKEGLHGYFSRLTGAASITDYERSTYMFIQCLGQAIIEAIVEPVSHDFVKDFGLYWGRSKLRALGARRMRRFPS